MRRATPEGCQDVKTPRQDNTPRPRCLLSLRQLLRKVLTNSFDCVGFIVFIGDGLSDFSRFVRSQLDSRKPWQKRLGSFPVPLSVKAVGLCPEERRREAVRSQGVSSKTSRRDLSSLRETSRNVYVDTAWSYQVSSLKYKYSLALKGDTKKGVQSQNPTKVTCRPLLSHWDVIFCVFPSRGSPFPGKW